MIFFINFVLLNEFSPLFLLYLPQLKFRIQTTYQQKTFKNMKLQDILALSGQPGLYKFIAQSKTGVIVESLTDGRRVNAPSNAKVSSMAEIAIYTETDDMPLAKVFEAIASHLEGKEAISHKSSPAELKSLFEAVIPDYDKDRVHVSDIKKVVSWYNTLTLAGITDFSIEEEADEETTAE